MLVKQGTRQQKCIAGGREMYTCGMSRELNKNYGKHGQKEYFGKGKRVGKCWVRKGILTRKSVSAQERKRKTVN